MFFLSYAMVSVVLRMFFEKDSFEVVACFLWIGRIFWFVLQQSVDDDWFAAPIRRLSGLEG